MSLPPNFGFLQHLDPVQRFSAGQQITAAGAPGAEMYYIKSGEVEISLNGKSLNIVGAGEIFGEMALIDAKQRYADAVAKTDCEVIGIDEKRFSFLVQEHPYFALNVMRVLAERLRKQNAS